MQISKKAFTMIELIFVIVVLGILAAVAIPKLTAIRADAYASAKSSSIMTGATEIAAHAIANGQTDSNLTIMSNSIASLANSGEAILGNKSAIIKAGIIQDCVTVRIDSNTTGDILVIEFGNANGDVECTTIQSLIDAEEYPMKLRGASVVY